MKFLVDGIKKNDSFGRKFISNDSKAKFYSNLRNPMQHYKTLTELHLANHLEAPQNPLFSMIGCLSSCQLGNREFTADCYIIAYKKLKSGADMYGRTPFDHDNGSLFFIKPEEIIEMKNLDLEERGFMMMIHQNYLENHPLFKEIYQFGFFDYRLSEALQLSPREEEIVLNLHGKIMNEYQTNPDEYSREIILSHISSLLKYAQRFYKRQFIDRAQVNGKVAVKFNRELSNYILAGNLETKGLPDIGFFAEKLLFSPQYLIDTLKQETGKTPAEFVHIYLISEAQTLLKLNEKEVFEIALSLGFENVSVFNKLFKKRTGMTPLQFRNIHLN